MAVFFLLALSSPLSQAARVLDLGARQPAALRVGAALLPDLVAHVLALTPSEPQVAWSTGGHDVVVAAADAWGGEHVLRGDRLATDVKFFPSGSRIVVADASGVSVWSALRSDGLWRAEWRLPGQPVVEELLEVQVFPDGLSVVGISRGMAAMVWDAASGQERQRLRFRGVCAQHFLVRVVAGGAAVVTGVSGRNGDPAVVWNATDGRVLHRLGHQDDVIFFMEASSCRTRVVTKSSEDVFVWRVDDGRIEQSMRWPIGWSLDLAVSAGAAHIVCRYRGSILALDGRTGRRLPAPESLGKGVESFALLRCRGGGDCVAAFSPHSASLWDLGSGDVTTLGAGGVAGVQRVAASPAHDVVAVCGSVPWGGDADEAPPVSAAAWDPATGRVLRAAASLGRAEWGRTCVVAVSSGGTMLERMLLG